MAAHTVVGDSAMNPSMIPFVVAISLIGVVVIYVAFHMIRKKAQTVPRVALRQGRNDAIVWLVGVVLATLGIATAIRCLYDWPLGGSVVAALGLLSAFFFVIFFGAWIRNRSKAGAVVLDCGEHPSKGLFLLNAVIWSLFTVPLSVRILVAVFHGKNDSLNGILAVAWLSCFCVYWFIMAFGRLQIRENGVWQYVALLKWDRIESYDWHGEQKRTLMLKRKTRIPFSGPSDLPVPIEHRDAVDELLRKHMVDRDGGKRSL